MNEEERFEALKDDLLSKIVDFKDFVEHSQLSDFKDVQNKGKIAEMRLATSTSYAQFIDHILLNTKRESKLK